MSKIYDETNMTELLEEAEKCIKCKVPKCRKACPVATDIPFVMNLFLEGRDNEATELLFENKMIFKLPRPLTGLGFNMS